jgi:hypothetical protein
MKNAQKGSLTLIIIIIGVVVIGAYLFFNRSSGKPSLVEVDGALRIFLVNDRCEGQGTVNSISGLRLGEYDKQLGGWPVYSLYEASCNSVGSSGVKYTTEYKSGPEQAKVPVAYARKSGGKTQVFIPDIFKISGF